MDPTETNPGAAPEDTTDADVLAAMDEGIAAATAEADPEPAAADPVADEPVADPPPGSQDAADAERAAAEEAAKADAAQSDADVEAEIAAMEKANGKPLSEDGKNRFRELSAEVKAFVPIKAELEKLGVKDVEGVTRLAKEATQGAELMDTILDTGATPEDYRDSLDYLRLVAQARTGDRSAAEKAFEVLTNEYQVLAKVLGKEVPGVFDPLEGHDDLIDEVEQGDITRARALEIANQRNLKKVAEEGLAAREQQTQAQRDAEDAKARELDGARLALNSLGQQLASEDPHFAAKQPALLEQIKVIRGQYPASQWATQAALAYARIPNPQPKPGVATGASVRPTAPIHQPLTPDFDDPMAAMEAGILAASR